MRLLRLKYLVVILIQLLLSKINAQTPSITSVKPTSGPIGTRVTIKGTNFSAISSNNTVYFGAVKAKIVSGSDTSLIVSSPSGATCQPISVTANGLTGYSSTPFITTFDGAAGQKISAAVFNRKIDFSGSNHSHEAIADIDGDGKPDIISTSGGISIYRNMGTDGIIDTNTFKTHIDSTIDGTNPQLPLISDIDGDGKLDILVTYYDGIAIFKNTSSVGNISFAPKKVIIMPQDPSTSAVADIDGDGKPDIIVASYYWKNKTNYMSIFRNTSTVGNVSFDTAVNFFYPSLPGRDGNFNLAIADIDGDGKLDIALNAFDSINFYKNVSTSGSITNSSLSKRLGIRYNFAGSLSFNDLDGDGKAEMIATSCCGISTILIYKNQAVLGEITDSSFASPVSFKYPPAITYSLTNIPISDIDGDGKPDIVFSADTSRIVILQNTTTKGVIDNTSFASVTNIKMVYGTGSLAVGDLDADGKPEIVFSDGGAIAIIKNIIKPRLLPVITSFSPTKAKAGGIVIIHGNSFTDATSVSFGGTLANSFKILDDSTIIAIVGNGSSGSIKVSTIDRSDSFGSFIFQLPTKPTITSFSPQSGKSGTKVTIYGDSFTGASAVSFGGINASSFSVISDSVIIAVLDSGESGSVSVTTTIGSGSLEGFIYCNRITPIISINASANGIAPSRLDTFLISHTSNSNTPSYKWSLNGNKVGSNFKDSIYIFNSLKNGDIISVKMIDSTDCGVDTAYSNKVYMYVSDGIVTTIAGNGIKGFSGDSSLATQANLYNPGSICFDKQNNLYIVDNGNNRIRKVDARGIITTIAGTGATNYNGDGVLATAASINVPKGIAIDGKGNILIADSYNNRIRKIDTNGIITTIAGTGVEGYSGDGGLAINAKLARPVRIVVDTKGNLYIPDKNNERIRKIDTSGIITTIAGTGRLGYNGDSILATSAQLYGPTEVAVDTAGNVYFADQGNYRIRKVDKNNMISTVGYADYPQSLAIDNSGNLYYGDSTNRIWSINNKGYKYIVAGNSKYNKGYSGDNKYALDAELNFPRGIAFDNTGNLYFADFNNNCVRKVTYSSNPLPLTISSFSAIPYNKTIQTNWHTSTELNTSHFIIQQSTDGSSFTDKGTVNAIGIGANSYSFTDATPTPGINYYRLKMVDKDGSFSYSKVVSVQLIIDNYQLSITPNPAKDKVNVKGNHIVSVKVIDNLGRVLRNISFRDACNPVLTLTGIPAGIYHLCAQTTDGKVSGVGLVID